MAFMLCGDPQYYRLVRIDDGGDAVQEVTARMQGIVVDVQLAPFSKPFDVKTASTVAQRVALTGCGSLLFAEFAGAITSVAILCERALGSTTTSREQRRRVTDVTSHTRSSHPSPSLAEYIGNRPKN